VGIELIDVAKFFKSPKRKKLMDAIWDRVMKDQTLRNSDQCLMKLTYAVILTAAKALDRNKKRQAIPKKMVRKVVRHIKKMLSQSSLSSSSPSSSSSSSSSDNYELTKQQFMDQFANYLQQVHFQLSFQR
ncbi:hypothetical protein RFI_04930, partial [Reticulomyxa filosa]